MLDPSNELKTDAVAGEELPRFWERRTNIAAAVLLGFAAVATSWATYQATRWSGVQAARYTEAGAMRVEAIRASTRGGQLSMVDVGTFFQWINAHMDTNEHRERFYRKHFRSEFIPAFEAWAADLQTNLESPRSPFQLPEYKVSLIEESERLEESARETFKQGEDANETGDHYVLYAVILASAMFFAGLAPQFPRLGLRLTFLIMAAVMCLFGVYRIALSPVT
ncbi:MAG TPA: hypothetical protein VFC26_01010 [Verrucomicrobiae bacterium]|nr:hypothetical protein [Verrucomicrobiae bacterium]